MKLGTVRPTTYTEFFPQTRILLIFMWQKQEDYIYDAIFEQQINVCRKPQLLTLTCFDTALASYFLNTYSPNNIVNSWQVVNLKCKETNCFSNLSNYVPKFSSLLLASLKLTFEEKQILRLWYLKSIILNCGM